MLVDCLTLWLSNLMEAKFDIDEDLREARSGALPARAGATVLVSNEVGFGIVPDNALARRFRDLQGVLNQRLAARAPRVVMMVAGIANRGEKPMTKTERRQGGRAPSRQDGEAQGRAGRGGRRQDRSRRACSSSIPAPARANRRRPSGLRCACSAAASGSASCSSSRAPGTPASATRSSASAIRCRWHTMGEGFTWETQDSARDIAAAERAWGKAQELMADPELRAHRSRRAQHRAALRLSAAR